MQKKKKWKTLLKTRPLFEYYNHYLFFSLFSIESYDRVYLVNSIEEQDIFFFPSSFVLGAYFMQISLWREKLLILLL